MPIDIRQSKAQRCCGCCSQAEQIPGGGGNAVEQGRTRVGALKEAREIGSVRVAQPHAPGPHLAVHHSGQRAAAGEMSRPVEVDRRRRVWRRPPLAGFDRRGLSPRVLLRPLNLIDVIYRDFRAWGLAFAPHTDERRQNTSGRAVRWGTDDMGSSGWG